MALVLAMACLGAGLTDRPDPRVRLIINGFAPVGTVRGGRTLDGGARARGEY